MSSPSKEGVKEYFEYKAEVYDEYCEAPWLSKMLREMDLRAVFALSGIKGTVLDLGCGTGRSLGILSNNRRVVIGLDISEAMLKKARAKAKDKKNDPIDLVLADAENLPFMGSAFDAVVSNYGTLNHLPNLGKAMVEVGRVMKVRGIFAAWVSNWWGLAAILVSFFVRGFRKTVTFMLRGLATGSGPQGDTRKISKSVTVRQIHEVFGFGRLRLVSFEALPLFPYMRFIKEDSRLDSLVNRISTLLARRAMFAQFGVGIFIVGEKVQ